MTIHKLGSAADYGVYEPSAAAKPITPSVQPKSNDLRPSGGSNVPSEGRLSGLLWAAAAAGLAAGLAVSFIFTKRS